jgi:peptide/nickel transport system permease protein
MTTYLIRRLLQGIVVLILVTLFIFLIMRLLPGDPIQLFVGQGEASKATAEELIKVRHEFGLDKSLPLQYLDWLGGVFHGRLGKSIFYRDDVASIIKHRLPVTIHLGVLSMLISSVLGITCGVICAFKRGKWIDTVLTVLANIGITVPSFWVGILLIYLLSLKLNLLPVYGYTSPFTDFWLSTRQIIMPVACLSLFPIASLTRQTRSSTLEVTRQDYIRTAWSKGLTERVIIIKHAIKNALIPVVTQIGMQVSIVFGGTVLIETVFNISGMGKLMAEAVFGHDYQIVQSGILIVATVVVLANLLVDISYGWLDPRIRYN